MSSRLTEIFEDRDLVEKIKKRLPHLFQLAELESSRAGKMGMEVGSVRERIIVALLIYKFGEANVETEIPITESEVDAKLFEEPISVKTITGKNFGGVKLIWTVDAQKAEEFREGYQPHCDILLVQINWENSGGFYYIPLEVQERVFKKIGRQNYIKLPKAVRSSVPRQICTSSTLGGFRPALSLVSHFGSFFVVTVLLVDVFRVTILWISPSIISPLLKSKGSFGVVGNLSCRLISTS